MSYRTIALVAMLCLSAGQAAADEVWSCSVIDDGKPQVIKFRAVKGKVLMSDWRSRLMDKFAVSKEAENTLQLIADDKDSLVAVSGVRTEREAGQLQETSI